MKKKYQPMVDFIERCSPVWQDRMRLGEWEIEHVFLDSYFGDDGEEDFKITAVCETRYHYYEAKIKWYLPSAIRHEDDKLEQTLVHELCHVLLAAEQSLPDRIKDIDTPTADALYEIACEYRETSTELAARALWKAWGPALLTPDPAGV